MTTTEKFYGPKLRLGRLIAGLTLAELGESVSASRQYIHQLESGSVPTEEMVDALADALNVYPSFFYAPIYNEVIEEQSHFRKLKGSPVSAKKLFLAYATIIDTLIDFLSEKLDFPPVDFPNYDVSDLDSIEEVALDIREHWSLSVDRPISSMTRVLENAGAIISTPYVGDNNVDAFSVDRSRPFVIRSTYKTSNSRLRFDLAHECGHLLMHSGIHTGDNITESQANRFASAFLFPKTPFLKEFPKSRKLDWITIFQMKQKWGISVAAIIYRANELEILDPMLYRRANIFIAKNGYKKNEPHEPNNFETPELLNTAFSTLYESYGLSVSDIASSLGIRKIVLCRILGIPENDCMEDYENHNVVNLNKYKVTKHTS